MKKLIILFFITLLTLPAVAKQKEFQNIFITDTTEVEEYLTPENIILKGYAEYLEDSETIYLKDSNNQFVLNIKVPQKINSEKLIQKQTLVQKPTAYTKYNTEEYNIIPNDYSSYVSSGNFSFGTTYGNEVDYAQFEQTTGVYTKYDSKWFALKTAYKRSIGSSNGTNIDYFYIIPEIKINKNISLKEVLSENITYNRKQAEFIVSINPFKKSKDSRLNIEFGTLHTYDENNSLIKNQLKFNTRFKL